jgi:hypothetical protein
MKSKTDLRGACHLPGNDGDARQQQTNDQLQGDRGCPTGRCRRFPYGLYLGSLAAESTQQPRPEAGRWSIDQDRAAFTAGYRRGYKEALAREAGDIDADDYDWRKPDPGDQFRFQRDVTSQCFSGILKPLRRCSL